MNKPKQSSEWDLCPNCKRPWKYHTQEDYGSRDIRCPNYSQFNTIFSWRTKKKK
jgi:hypothetical protein